MDMNTSIVYKKLLEFKNRHSGTIAWRLREHAQVIGKHLATDEKVIYAFAAQKNDNPFNIITTAAVVLTNRRLLVASKRVVFGYFFNSITPDMFNDIKVSSGIIWGKVYIDTIKEFVTLSNISKPALTEIENEISTYMIEEKKKYGLKREEED